MSNFPDRIKSDLESIEKIKSYIYKVKKIISLSEVSQREKKTYNRALVRLSRLLKIRLNRINRDLALSRRDGIISILSLSSHEQKIQTLEKNKTELETRLAHRVNGGSLPSDGCFEGPISGSWGMVYELDPLSHGLLCPFCGNPLDIGGSIYLSLCSCGEIISTSEFSGSKNRAQTLSIGLINPIDPRRYNIVSDQRLLSSPNRIDRETKKIADLKEAKRARRSQARRLARQSGQRSRPKKTKISNPTT